MELCKSKENPADVVSRGLLESNSEALSNWLKGPNFLYLPKESWPKWKRKNTNLQPEGSDQKRVFVCISKKENGVFKHLLKRDCFDPKTFSSWKEIVRIRAWINRFVSNCRNENKERQFGEVSFLDNQPVCGGNLGSILIEPSMND